MAWEGAGRRRGARGSVGARVAGGGGDYGAQKDNIILYYDREPKAREKFWAPWTPPRGGLPPLFRENPACPA